MFSRTSIITSRGAIRAAVAVAAVALSLLSFAPAASAWAHVPLPDVKIFGRTEVRTYEIDVNDVCRWQYGSAAKSKMVGQSWRDWRCRVAGSDRSVNFTGYCRARYGHGGSVRITATHRTTGAWTATSWRCRREAPAGALA